MKPEKNYHELLHDLVEEKLSPQARADVLEQGLRCLRHRTRMRRTALGLSCAAAVLLVVAALQFTLDRTGTTPGPSMAKLEPVPAPAHPTRPVVPGTSIEILSDADLLRLFQDRPLALVGKGDSRQLILLDETP